MMNLHRLVSLLMVTATPVLAQAGGGGRTVDEGTFMITRAGAPAQTESFRITRTDDGLFRATGQLTDGNHRVTSMLIADSVGTPVDYRVDVRDNGASTMTVSAVTRAGRLSARSQFLHGDESMREYPVAAGSCLILEKELVHQTFFIALGRHTGGVQVIDPRAAQGANRTLTAHGLEPVTIAGRQVTATHYSLSSASARREFWVDANGRVLQVEIPSVGVKAIREELPR